MPLSPSRLSALGVILYESTGDRGTEEYFGGGSQVGLLGF